MRKWFCENCNKLVNYNTCEKEAYDIIHGKKYYYSKIFAFCNECGEEISTGDITDKNLKKLEKAYKLKNKHKR